MNPLGLMGVVIICALFVCIVSVIYALCGGFGIIMVCLLIPVVLAVLKR